MVGAYDRHNFGDLLFPHIAAKLLAGQALAGEIVHGGLVRRDMRRYGGHKIHALPELASRYADRPVRLFHVGGELLTCSLWEAAVMLLAPDEAQKQVLALASRPAEQERWARSFTGLRSSAPYVASKELFPRARGIFHNAVGGADILDRPPALREEVLRKLGETDAIGVRDGCTQAALASFGVDSFLLPDPVVMLGELCSAEIAMQAGAGEGLQVSQLFPGGYFAVQFSGDFSDDRNIDAIASQLDKLASLARCGIVLFRAGAAPWHDELSAYRRLADKMKGVAPYIFNSLDVWDICVLISRSVAYCGSSLHGLIVASALSRPGICMRHPAPSGRMTKHEAYIGTWGSTDFFKMAQVDQLAEAVGHAANCSASILEQNSARMAAHYMQGFTALMRRFM